MLVKLVNAVKEFLSNREMIVNAIGLFLFVYVMYVDITTATFEIMKYDFSNANIVTIVNLLYCVLAVFFVFMIFICMVFLFSVAIKDLYDRIRRG